MTKIIDFSGDFLYVLRGKVRLYMEDISQMDERTLYLGMELNAGDYLDPDCKHFPTERLTSINRWVREHRVVKMTIQHSAWREEATRFFYIPGKIYHLYADHDAKNYLSIFSKEDIE